MLSPLPLVRPFRSFLTALLAVSGFVASGNSGASDENIIPNGDFSQGNTGFTSDLPYIAPAFNCLWGGYYTVATDFNTPLLHKLIAPEPFLPSAMRAGNEKVFFANAGGTEPLVVWASKVKCQPDTQYLISFNCISFSGHIEGGTPPHQVATREWLPEFEIRANDQPSASFEAGLGKYYKARMIWKSKKATSAVIKIVRLKMAHWGGLIGISNIEMVPLSGAAKSVDR